MILICRFSLFYVHTAFLNGRAICSLEKWHIKITIIINIFGNALLSYVDCLLARCLESVFSLFTKRCLRTNHVNLMSPYTGMWFKRMYV